MALSFLVVSEGPLPWREQHIAAGYLYRLTDEILVELALNSSQLFTGIGLRELVCNGRVRCRLVVSHLRFWRRVEHLRVELRCGHLMLMRGDCRILLSDRSYVPCMVQWLLAGDHDEVFRLHLNGACR